MALLISLLLTWGCDYSPSQSNDSPVNTHVQIAQRHSEGLEFVFDRLQETSLEQASSKTLRRLVEKYSKEYAERELGLQPPASGTIVGMSRVTFSSSTKGSSVISGVSDSLITRLSSDQLYYIKRIIDLSASAPSLENLKADLQSIEKKVNNRFRKEEAEPILLSSAIALDSRKYWATNSEKWVEMLRHLETQDEVPSGIVIKDDTTCDFEGGNLAEEDVKGAVAGAIGGAILGPGAALGAAAGAASFSAAEGVDQIEDCL